MNPECQQGKHDNCDGASDLDELGKPIPCECTCHHEQAFAARTSGYRTWLTRRWSFLDEPSAVFVMLNPSTADEQQDDPTIRRCIGFAKREGYGGLTVVNLYALRTTNPAGLWTHPDPVGRFGTEAGPGNDRVLTEALDQAEQADGRVIVAWGVHARPERVAAFRAFAGQRHVDLYSLGVTKSGAPRHPLYVPAMQPLTPWPG